MNKVKRQSRNSIKENSVRGAQVGGRLPESHPVKGRGGYQDIFTGHRITLRDLRHAGLNEELLYMAECMGISAFVKLWEFVEIRSADQNLLKFPRISTLGRNLRNRYIASSAKLGVKTRDIRDSLGQTGVSITRRYVRRIVATQRKRRPQARP